MRTVYFVTENRSKFEEAKLLLKNVRLVMKNLKLAEIQTPDQEKVVLDKARQAFYMLKKPVIVDDTGIYFDDYENFPGTYTKPLVESIGFKGVERLLNGNRKAHFQTLLCYKDAETEKVFAGVWKGRIARSISRKFNPEWQYNSIFVPEGFRKHLSEIPMEERARHSHRKKAIIKLMRWLR